MKKFEKTKGWIKEHKEDLYIAGFIGGMVVVYGGFIAAAIKAANKELAEQNELTAALNSKLSDAAARGATILPGGPDGFWIIENKIAS